VIETLRSEFPALERLAYLNAGSIGPIPRRAAEAAQREIQANLMEGRGGTAHFDRMLSLAGTVRTRVAALLGCSTAEVALTGSTTDGVNAVVSGFELGAGDEVLTSDEEHPGLLAPLAGAERRSGVKIRVSPFEALAGAVGAGTRLVACSHVSWRTGRVVDVAAIAATGTPLLLDGAQGLGAVPVDVRALGCDFYAAAGQKWLCGPVGTGYLYVREDRLGDLTPARPNFGTLADPTRPLDSPFRDGAAGHDTGLLPTHHSSWALASLDSLEQAGIQSVLERGPTLAARLAELLDGNGLTVAPRGRSTLVSWEAEHPERESARLLEQGFLLRHLPGTPYVRASVGAWSTEEELERLAAAAAGPVSP
jgi:selenocysteine lyase/cysteine desulfurase